MSLGLSGLVFRSGLFEYTHRHVFTSFILLLLVFVLLFFLFDSYWEGNL